MSTVQQGPSVGLVHDYLLVMRGAERTFAEMAACWPEAPIYTLLYDSAGTNRRFDDRALHPSHLQRFGSQQHKFRRLAPFFPHAVGQLPLSQHDLVVSSSSAFAHGVRPGADAQHVCYCHSPFRYAWHERFETELSVPRVGRPVMRHALTRFRTWDIEAARRVDHYIANSQITRERIQMYYGRDAYAVIHPPVDVHRFRVSEPRDYFLFVGELVRHKRVEVALQAAQMAGKRMKVVGSGPDLSRLKAEYGQVAEFAGRVSDAELADFYAGALAVITPNVEEFGIVAVESQAAGRPVIAVDAGGAQETVIEEETGVLVPLGTPKEFGEVMSEVDFTRFDSQRIARHAAKFSVDAFKDKLRQAVAAISESDRARARSRREGPEGAELGGANRPQRRAPVPV